MQFSELNIMPAVLRALKEEEYELPTPIQEEAIPVILSGRDLLGCAQTGTGKTAAFAIPTLQLLSEEKVPQNEVKRIRALIITPTRELALQIYESFCTYGRYTSLSCCVIFGGVSQKPQEEKLQQGVDILIATPGRLLDLMNQNLVEIKHIKIFILDEADRMLDMGFIHDVNRIIAKTPVKKQTLLFSATIPPSIEEMSRKLLMNPVKIAVTPVSSTVDTIQQYLYYVDKENKKDLLLHLLKDSSITSVLVFTRTKHGADRVARQLEKANISAKAIHGDKSQGARQLALSHFKEKTLRVLVATDIAARGIDIDELSHVINYDLPEIPETYVHRIGRTGRAGLDGIAISFCDFDEKELLADIEKLIKKSVTEVKNHPYPLLKNYPAEKNTQPRRSPKQKVQAPKEDARKDQTGKASTPRNAAQNTSTRKDHAGKASAPRNAVQNTSTRKNQTGRESDPRNAAQSTSTRKDQVGGASAPRNAAQNTSTRKDQTGGASAPRGMTQNRSTQRDTAQNHHQTASKSYASYRNPHPQGNWQKSVMKPIPEASESKALALAPAEAQKKERMSLGDKLKSKFRMSMDGTLKEQKKQKKFGGHEKNSVWNSKKK